MIRNIVGIFLVTAGMISCYPQRGRTAEILNIAPPYEVNSLDQHKQYPRSIGSQSTNINNIENTIEEVEAMLKANPTLPRLTRGEILDLLDNITKTDQATNTERDPKAIMVVMPFTPSNSDGNNMEDLFTKAPVTHIVGSEPFKKINSEIFETDSVELTTERYKTSKGRIQFPKSTTLSTTEGTSTTIDVGEQKFGFVQKQSSKRKRPTQSTTQTPQPSTSTRRRVPVRRRPFTTEKHPNHKYPDDVSTETSKLPFPSYGIKVIEAPKLNIGSDEDLFMQEDKKQEVFVKDVPSVYNNKVLPKPQSTLGTHEISLGVPENLKSILNDMSPKDTIDIEQSTLKTSLDNHAVVEDQQLKNLMATFALLQQKTMTTSTIMPDITNVADNLTPDMKELLINFGLMPNPNQSNNKPESASQIVESFNPVKAEIKPESYIGFRPLPEDTSSRNEMEELLARYGLGKNLRKEKSIPKKSEDGPLTFDMIPDEYKGVLEDVGLTDLQTRNGKMIRTEPLIKTQEKQHVYNPADTEYATEEELNKLDKLLDVVKQLEKLNGTATDEDLKKIDMENLKDLINSLNNEQLVPLDEQKAPNPTDYDYGLSKNEVKRQEESSSTTSTTTQSSTAATEEAKTPNIKDLEDSFGGPSEEVVSSTSAPETTTQSRRTGFYYLVDWNTFLDIDDQKGKRVNLRFQPTIGDPKRFYSVTVP